jgi:hypothetical protein
VKLVTNWPIEVKELESDPLEEEEPAQEQIVAGYSAQFQPACSMAPTSWVNDLAVSVALFWPVAVIIVCILLITTIGHYTFATIMD